MDGMEITMETRPYVSWQQIGDFMRAAFEAAFRRTTPRFAPMFLWRATDAE